MQYIYIYIYIYIAGQVLNGSKLIGYEEFARGGSACLISPNHGYAIATGPSISRMMGFDIAQHLIFTPNPAIRIAACAAIGIAERFCDLYMYIYIYKNRRCIAIGSRRQTASLLWHLSLLPQTAHGVLEQGIVDAQSALHSHQSKLVRDLWRPAPAA
jgi:hypothetical protein